MYIQEYSGLGTAAWDGVKFTKEVSDVGNPVVLLSNVNKKKTATKIDQRVKDNKDLRESPKFEQDKSKVRVADKDIDDMFAKKKPLGFKDEKQFSDFKGELDTAVKDAGLGDSEVGLKGTATTFYSENPGKALGHHWDANPAELGDYDLNITSDKMIKVMDKNGYKPHEKYDVFKTEHVNDSFKSLDDFQEKWTNLLGRDVNFVGYPKQTARDVTEYILRGD